MTNQEIAHELTCTAHAVQAHLSNIFAMLHVASRTEAVLYALKKGWLPWTNGAAVHARQALCSART
jgi:DNA-binding NarL/FixJ family response regulator